MTTGIQDGFLWDKNYLLTEDFHCL